MSNETDDLSELARRMNSDATPSSTSGMAPRRQPPARKSASTGASIAPTTSSPPPAPAGPTAPVTAPEKITAALTPRAQGSDLVSVRVQPGDLAAWFNELLDTGSFVFDARRGDIGGAILLVAQLHVAEIMDLLERWGGVPTDPMKAMVWKTYKEVQKQRQPRVVDGD